jgi:hypothetical protein
MGAAPGARTRHPVTAFLDYPAGVTAIDTDIELNVQGLAVWLDRTR